MTLQPSVDLSVVVIALNEGAHLCRTVTDLHASLPPRSEILVIDDGSSDGSGEALAATDRSVRVIRTERIGVARARNLGARESRGSYIFFADAHLGIEAGCWAPLLESLEHPGVGAVAPAIIDMRRPEHTGYGIRFRGPDLILKWLDLQSADAYAVPLVPWCCGGLRREVFEATGGFDEGMIRWGMIDNEMSLRLWLEGYDLQVVPRARVAHLFREEFPYHLEGAWFIHNTLRLAFLHLDAERIRRVVDELRGQEGFSEALALAMTGDLCARRAALERRRARPIREYFETFPVEW